MGSGSTGIAAKAEGMNFLGIEMDPEFVQIAEKRIAAWEEFDIEERDTRQAEFAFRSLNTRRLKE